jgi:hypothetical protein
MSIVLTQVQTQREQGDSEAYISAWLSYLVLLGGFGTVVVSAYMVVSTYSSLPRWDEWAMVDHLALHHGGSFAWLFAQHNEHRIFFTKLFFLIDTYAFRGSQIFLLVSVFLGQLLHVALLSASLWVLGGMRGPAWRTGTGLIGFCMFSPIQQENLVFGFQVGFILPGLMATLSTFSLLLYQRSAQEYKRRTVALWLVLAIAAAIAATWSLSNGMLLWPLLLLTAMLLRMRVSSVIALLASGAASIALYFYHYRSPSLGSPAYSIQALGRELAFVATYFGSTWFHGPAGWAAVVVGLAGVSAALVAAVRVMRQRNAGSPLLTQLSVLMLFCIATAALTALGRQSLGAEQAGASRYQVFALLFWCSLGLSFLLWITANTDSGLNAFSAFLVVMMLALTTQVRMPLREAQWYHVRQELISLALLTDVHDLTELAEAYPDQQTVLRDAEYLKQNPLSVFAGNRYSQLGQTLESVYRLLPPEECSGHVASVQRLPTTNGEGLRITGYGWNRARSKPVTQVIAVVDGRISGFGSTIMIPLERAKLGPEADPKRFGWVGYVRDASSTSRVKLYAVLDRNPGSACPFAEVVPN